MQFFWNERWGFFWEYAIIYKTKYNEYWKENIKLFKVTERSEGMPVVLTILSPSSPNISHPKLGHRIRYYGLYSSRTRGKAVKDFSLVKYGYTPVPQKVPEHAADPEMETTSNKASRRNWARRYAKRL
jgi:hypothetical protein